MSKIYKLEAVEDYIFCGLYYRYKHELKLPYKPVSANEVFVEAIKDAIFIIVNEWGLKRKHPRAFISDAAEAFKEKFSRISINLFLFMCFFKTLFYCLNPLTYQSSVCF